MKVVIIRKEYIFILLLGILIGFLLRYLVFQDNHALPVSYLPISNKIIAIDPGHGGVDPGAIGVSGTNEDEINLKIGLKLKRLIEQSGGIVIMTREKDIGLYSDKAKTLREMKTEDLHKRREIVEISESEIFISIHLNDFTRPEYYGAQTFYKEGSEEGKKLALIIQSQLRNILDKDNTREPQKRNDLYVLNEVDIPSVLVECGFLSNINEEAMLKDEIYQEKIAWAIYIGIMNYFSDMDQSPF